MNTEKMNQKKSRKWFRARQRRHDPMLVLNMSLFNSGQQLGSDLQSGSAARERVELTMNTTLSTNLVAQAPPYVVLQREMHDALRAQHPEWVEPNGDCPTCDSYESRLAQMLSLSLAIERARVRLSK